MNQSKDAFHLIELMIVVAIIVFLATMALPRYSSYFTKARQAEVAVNLAALHTAEQAYWAECGTYNKILWGNNGIGWKPEGYKGGGKDEQFYYTYGFFFPGAQEGKHYFTGKLGLPAQYMTDTYANKEKFKACALGGTEKDVDAWSIDESRRISNITAQSHTKQ